MWIPHWPTAVASGLLAGTSLIIKATTPPGSASSGTSNLVVYIGLISTVVLATATIIAAVIQSRTKRNATEPATPKAYEDARHDLDQTRLELHAAVARIDALEAVLRANGIEVPPE